MKRKKQKVMNTLGKNTPFIPWKKGRDGQDEHFLRSKPRSLHRYYCVLTSYLKSYKTRVFVSAEWNRTQVSASNAARAANLNNAWRVFLTENLASHLLSSSRRYKLGPDTLRKIPAPFSTEESQKKTNISSLMSTFTNDFCQDPAFKTYQDLQ